MMRTYSCYDVYQIMEEVCGVNIKSEEYLSFNEKLAHAIAKKNLEMDMDSVNGHYNRIERILADFPSKDRVRLIAEYIKSRILSRQGLNDQDFELLREHFAEDERISIQPREKREEWK